MQKFDVLDPNLNIFQSRFLEASAGTGKTFAIEHLMTRFLLESTPPVALQEMLAVTFTREAAQEMRIRMRAKLEEKNMVEALAHLDEMQIFTIHGFCHQMLSEFAFEAKTSFAMQTPDQSDQLFQMRQVVEDFFRIGKTSFANDITALLKRARYDLNHLVDKIVDAMQKEEEPQAYTLPSLPPMSFTKLWEEFLPLSSRYKRMKFEQYKPQVKKFAQYISEKDFALLAEEKQWFFEKLKEEEGFFHTLQTTLTPILSLLRDPEEMIRRVAKECRNRWNMKASRNDHYTYDDLLKKMRKALEVPAFVEKVRAKYKLIIIDEFQDTDPVQWDVFKFLFLDTHFLYLVGDPKQSIYGFRNADIYTYMQAAETLGKEKRAILDTNFRSSPRLVNELNDLFMQNPNWIALPSLPDTLYYHPVKAGRKSTEFTENPITHFGVRADPGRERSWPTKTMEEKKLFPYIANEIIRLKKDFSFSDFVVLIKDRFQAKRLQLFFQRYKIPSSIKKTLHLAESRGFIAMEMLLKAIAYPEKDACVRAVLKGPLMEGDENPFFDLRNFFEEKGFAATFSYFMQNFFSAKGDHFLYASLHQTAELLMEAGKVDPFALLHLMQKWKQTTPEIDPRLSLRGDEGEDKVAIMTTFASKGLEFEVVFALGMASSHPSKDREEQAEHMRQLYVAFTRAREKLYIPRLIDPSKTFTPSPIEQFYKNIDVPIEWIKDITPQTYQEKHKDKIPFQPPLKNQWNFPIETLTSFSSLSQFAPPIAQGLSEIYETQDLNQKNRHTLPLGSETGTLIHSIFEAYFANRSIPLEQLICETIIGTHLEGWEEVLFDLIHSGLHIPLIDNFSLSDLYEEDYLQEMEFLFPTNSQWIKGFVDLVFKKEDVFYLLDWKTNWLGPSDEHYTEERLHQAMEEHDYYLQARLYTQAVQRYVKQLYKNPQFGGAFYVFLRGKGVVCVNTSQDFFPIKNI